VISLVLALPILVTSLHPAKGRMGQHASPVAVIGRRGAGLGPSSLKEIVSGIQVLDVYLPSTNGRELAFTRYTQPEKTHKMLLAQLGRELPVQSPTKITQKAGLGVEWLRRIRTRGDALFATTYNFLVPPFAKVGFGLSLNLQLAAEFH
jgi:hypothetical protein